MAESVLPALDCHAHIAPDVTTQQLDALGDVTVFAVTRSLGEAAAVRSRTDRPLVWACGVHPGVDSARNSYDPDLLQELLSGFAIVGEVGLDRRGGAIDVQRTVFSSVLTCIEDAPVLVSVHSTGCTDEVVDLVEATPHVGIILHWFLGDRQAVDRAAKLGCYFSVNSAMPTELVAAMPSDRLLPETDFPATRRRGAKRPGDVALLEAQIGDTLKLSPNEVRVLFYKNLRTLSLESGAIERLPESLADRLIAI